MYKKLVCSSLSLAAAFAIVCGSAGAAGAAPYIPGDPDYVPGSEYGATPRDEGDGTTTYWDPSGHLISTLYPDGTLVSGGGSSITYPDGSGLHRWYRDQESCQKARGSGYNIFPLWLMPCEFNPTDQFFYRTAPRTAPPTGSSGN